MALQNNALVTLAQAKTRLGITSDLENDYLEELINSISDSFESYCGRIFRELEIENYKLKGTDRQEIVLPHRPVTAISKVEINGVEVSAKTDDDTTGYFIAYDNAGRLGYNGKVIREVGWNSTGLVNNTLEFTPNYDYRFYNVNISYTGGFTTIPSNIQNVALSEIAREYQYKANGYREVLQEKIQSVSISATKDDIDSNTGFSKRTLNVLNQYKQVAIC